MTTQTLVKKIEKVEKELISIRQPKSIWSKMRVDSSVIKQASKAMFDFDIEKFVSKKDLKLWK